MIFGKLMLFIVGAVISIPLAVMGQEAMETVACEGEIAFSKNFYEGSSDIYLLGTHDPIEIPLTNSGKGTYLSAEQPSWSPDGKRIVFSGLVTEPAGSSSYNMDIFIVDANGSHLERLTHTTSDEIQPVFSPDGKRIAFATNRNGNWQVYVMNNDGSEPINLTNSKANDGEQGIAWSPDGTRIAFVTDRGKGQISEGRYSEQQIYLVDGVDNLQSSTKRLFTNLTENIDICPAGSSYSSLAWSHTGQWLGFALSCGELYDVYALDVDKIEANPFTPVNLTDEGETSTSSDGFLGLSWSPDDQQLVYVSSPAGRGNFGGELLIVNVNELELESLPHQLTHYNSSEVFVASPAWQPCQTNLDAFSELPISP